MPLRSFPYINDPPIPFRLSHGPVQPFASFFNHIYIYIVTLVADMMKRQKL